MMIGFAGPAVIVFFCHVERPIELNEDYVSWDSTVIDLVVVLRVFGGGKTPRLRAHHIFCVNFGITR